MNNPYSRLIQFLDPKITLHEDERDFQRIQAFHQLESGKEKALPSLVEALNDTTLSSETHKHVCSLLEKLGKGGNGKAIEELLEFENRKEKAAAIKEIEKANAKNKSYLKGNYAWFILPKDQGKSGPFSLNEIQKHLKSKKYGCYPKVRKECDSSWCASVNIENIYPELLNDVEIEKLVSPISLSPNLDFKCPLCSAIIEVERKLIGMEAECPCCKQNIVISVSDPSSKELGKDPVSEETELNKDKDEDVRIPEFKKDAFSKTPIDYSSIILDLAPSYSDNPGFFIAGEIPEKKEKKSRKTCEIPNDEPLLILIDCTVFGSAKNCLVFTPEKMYFHNDWGGVAPGAFAIPYSEFKSCLFVDGGFKELKLADKQFLNIAGAAMKKKCFIELLNEVKSQIRGIENNF